LFGMELDWKAGCPRCGEDPIDLRGREADPLAEGVDRVSETCRSKDRDLRADGVDIAVRVAGKSCAPR